MTISVNHLLLLPLVLSFVSASVAGSIAVSPFKADGGNGDKECVYTLYVRTGSTFKAGTDSIISLDLAGADGYGVRIANIEAWGGLMGVGYNYFEYGNLDIFSGRGPCMASPPCFLNVTSDGSAAYHGWYCNYIELTTTGPHVPCAQQTFTVEQWLATDTSPYKLFAEVNNCPKPEEGGGGDEMLGRRGLSDRTAT